MNNREGTTTVTGASLPSVANNIAVTRLAEARCPREVTCNNIGADRRYASNDVCALKIRTEMKDDLDTTDCPGGVAQKELDACVASIKAESCDNVIDKIERVAACRKTRWIVRPGSCGRVTAAWFRSSMTWGIPWA